jgi:flavorubredoxin
MGSITEVAPDVYRVSVFAPQLNLQFNHFLVKDDEPLLFHTGLRGMFPEVREAVAQVLDPSRLRWIGFSHFESDECGALNQWLSIAPNAEPVCGLVGALVSVNDFADRPAHVLPDGETISTGARRFRFHHTPHLPHGWDAGVLFEETERTLFCSDLFHQWGDREPVATGDIITPCREALATMEAGPFANYVPYTHHTGRMLSELAEMKPRTLAAMHGSTYRGNGEQALRDLAVVMREMLGQRSQAAS